MCGGFFREVPAIRLLISLAILLSGSALAEAPGTAVETAAQEAAPKEAGTSLPAQILGTPLKKPLSAKSDAQLTEIARRWNDLSTDERDALITEVKSRMARGGNREGVLRIRLTRRYGTVVRHPNGATLRIERVQRQVRAGMDPASKRRVDGGDLVDRGIHRVFVEGALQRAFFVDLTQRLDLRCTEW